MSALPTAIPTDLASVLRETMTDVATLAPTIPLIGRDDELEHLRSAWQLSCAGEANAVVVAGDAGIGKSRLIAEIAEEVAAADGLVLTGHCLGLGQAAPPYLPVLEILAQAREAGATTAGADELREADPVSDQVRFFEAVHTVLVEATRHAPVLVVVEDLHWSDASTRDLLLFLLSRLSTARLLIVLSYRSDDLDRSHPLRRWLASVARMRGVDRLDLGPLPPDDAVTFVRALLPGDDDADLVGDVADRSEGNAFFAEELASAVDGGRAEISDVLASVLLDRIERLSTPAQKVVRAAAIVGQRDLWASSLERLAASTAVGLAPGEVEQALRECVQSHVLVVTPDGGFAFRHALLREAVLADLLPGEASRLHAAYLPVLQEDQPPGWRAAVAFHALRAGDVELALRSHLDAATDASSGAAHGDALGHLERALELWRVVPDREAVTGTDELGLTLRACDEATASGRLDRAMSYARAGVEMADDVGTVVQQAGARRRLAKLLYFADDWREAERLIAHAWSLLEDQPATAERAWVLSTMSFGEINSHRRTLVQRAIDEARAVGAPGPEADALISSAFLQQHDGDVEDAMETLLEARSKAREGHADDTELRALFNMAILRYDHGRIAEAVEILNEGTAAAARYGRTWSGYGGELAWLADLVDIARGEFSAVVDRTTTALPAAPHGARPLALGSRALASAWLGDWERVDADVATFGPAEKVARACLPGGIADSLAAHAVLTSWLLAREAGVAEAAIAEALDGPEFPDDMVQIRVGAVRLWALADLARRGRDADAAAPGCAGAGLVEHVFTVGVPRGDTAGPEALLWLARARAEAARAVGDDPAPWRAVVEAAALW